MDLYHAMIYDYNIVFILILFVVAASMRKNGDRSKNGGKGVGKGPKHLISQIVRGQPVEEEEEVIECRYGIYCAHLRTQGKCSMPHRKSHFHFLNLVAPAGSLQDEEKEEQKLSKKQKKERKIIEKTIQKQIDIATLDRKEIMLKNMTQSSQKQQLIAQLNKNQKLVLEMVGCSTVSGFFSILKEAKESKLDMMDIKKKAMIQLKKKNQKLYTEVIDKEYRIANRLIKANAKNIEFTLLELYRDINYNTIEEVRSFFQGWFQEGECIYHEEEDNLVISRLLSQLLFAEPDQYELEYYFVKDVSEQSVRNIKSNAIFYNLMVPFKMFKEMSFNKFLYIDCQDLSLLRISELFAKEYMNTFHSRCKNAPEYPFGQLELNISKFQSWISKIQNKYQQSNTEFKIVFFVDNIAELFLDEEAIEQFAKQKINEKKQILQKLKQIFPSIFVILLPTQTKSLQKNIRQFFQIQKSQAGQLSL